MSLWPSGVALDGITPKAVALHLDRVPALAVCDPCIATATGLPLTTVARATAQLIQGGDYTGWTGTCPRCGEVRPVIRSIAAWSRGSVPAPARVPPAR
jgi:hypothetical protein